MPRIKAMTFMLSLATLCVPVFAQGTDPAVRDSYSALNYVQGQATLNGQSVTTNPASAPRHLHAGDTLATTDGSADLMLAPGALLRVGNGTNVQLVAAGGNRAEVRIDSGRANVAVNTIRPDSLLLVDMPNGQTQLLKRGLYTFDPASATVRVFNGRADVFPGSDTSTLEKPVKVKDGHDVVLSDARVRPAKFDAMNSEDDLLPWTGPQEAHADGDYGLQSGSQRVTSTEYAGNYGYGFAPYAFGDGYPIGYGWGYPYGLYGYPYGFYGYPFGLGVGFGYGGFYRGGYGYGIGHAYGGFHGAYGGLHGGYEGGRSGFAGGGFHGGGGGFHGGGGGHR